MAPLPPGADDADAEDSRTPAARIRSAERRLGIYRPGRSPWVWVLGPGLNAVGTAAVVAWFTIPELGWPATVPLAAVAGACMGAMAWAFMGTSWDQEQDEAAAADTLASELRDQAVAADTPASELRHPGAPADSS